MIKKYVILSEASEHPMFTGWNQYIHDSESDNEKKLLKRSIKTIIDPWLNRTLISNSIFNDFGFSIDPRSAYNKNTGIKNFFQIGKTVNEKKHDWSPQDFIIITTAKFFKNNDDKFTNDLLIKLKEKCDKSFASEKTFSTGGGAWSYTPLNGSRHVFSDSLFSYVAGHAHSVMQFTGLNVFEQALNGVHFLRSGIYKFPDSLHDLMIRHLDLINEDIIK